MYGLGFALVGLQAVQAQVTIDIEKLTCYHFLADKLTELKNPRHLAERLCERRAWQDEIEPLSAGHLDLAAYCKSHMDTLVLDAARNVFGADK